MASAQHCYPGSTGRRRVIAAATAAMMWAVSGALGQVGRSEIDFAKGGIGTAPAGFDFWRSGQGQPGEWVVVHDTSIDALAIEQLSSDSATLVEGPASSGLSPNTVRYS